MVFGPAENRRFRRVAPAAGKTLPTGGPLRGPPVGRGFPADGAAQPPKIYDFRSAQKICIKNRSAWPAQKLQDSFLGWQSRMFGCLVPKAGRPTHQIDWSRRGAPVALQINIGDFT